MLENITDEDYLYDNESYEPEYDFMYLYVIPRIVPIFYMFVVIFGACGNLLVIVVFGLDSHNRDSTNALIINLALCDLLFIVFCVPPTAINYATDQWPFGPIVCSGAYYLMHCSVLGSMWTLVLLTIDRFLAIALPLRSRPWRSVKNAVKVCTLMWISISLVCVPVTQLYKQTEFHYNGHVRTACIFTEYMNQTAPVWQILTYHLSFSVGGYLIPLSCCLALNVWMIRRLSENPFWSGGKQPQPQGLRRVSNSEADPCASNYDTTLSVNGVNDQHAQVYLSHPTNNMSQPMRAKKDRMKRRVLHMITLVSFVFGVCWLPMNVIYIVYAIRYKRVEGGEYVNHDKLVILSAVSAQVMAYMNSSLNPILYGFMSSNFRRGVTNVLNKFCCFNHKFFGSSNSNSRFVPPSQAEAESRRLVNRNNCTSKSVRSPLTPKVLIAEPKSPVDDSDTPPSKHDHAKLSKSFC